VRGATILISRLLCSLALILAALPIRAGMPLCVPTSLPAPMACCATKAKAAACPMHAQPKASCCAGTRVAAPTKTFAAGESDPCRCELKSAPPMPSVNAKVASGPSVEIPVLAILPSLLPVLVFEIPWAEPGIVGLDSGPPSSGVRHPDHGRAPPAR
jgi:hypothetical protein